MRRRHRVLFITDYNGDDYLGIMTISSLLKRHGHEVDAVDDSIDAVIDRLKDNIPTILAYSIVTEQAGYYLALNRAIKKVSNVFSVFGGPHPTAVPHIIETDGVDGVCIGEGEYPMLELVEKMDEEKPANNIANWWIKQDRHIFKNRIRPPLTDIDALPPADRELFSMHPFFNPEKMHVMASRGCQHTCTYCFNSCYHRLYGDQVPLRRQRSVQSVLSEILTFKKKYPLRFVVFDDAVFTSSKEWLARFSGEYKKYVGIPFFCNVRPDGTDEETVRYLKMAGCHGVSMGFETADESLRREVLGRPVKAETIAAAAQRIKKHGLRLKTSNMIGIPGAGLRDDIETIKANSFIKADFSSVFILYPFAGTELWRSRGKYEHDPRPFYSLKTKREQRYLRRLSLLFALAVEFPMIRNALSFLIRLPLGGLFRISGRLWEGYCAFFRLYPGGGLTFMKGLKKYVRIFRTIEY